MIVDRKEHSLFMCTCITYQTDEFYFGRNLDLEYSFGEQIVITPRIIVSLLKGMRMGKIILL